MLPLADKIRVALFVAAVAGVYLTAGILIARWGIRRLWHQAPSASRFKIFLHQVVFAFAAVGLVCIAYGYWVEPDWLEVTHARVESAKLPKATLPIRIALFSDTHTEATPRLEERLPEVIARERPDLIAFTGDSLNEARGLPVFRRCLRRLAGIAPTFAVRGNWDVDRWHSLDLFGGTGVRELNSAAAKVTVRGVDLWVAGVPSGSEVRISETLGRVPEGALTIFLYHSPEGILEVPKHKVDLFLVGHTHGGQVALPYYGAIVTSTPTGKRFEAGLYRVDQTWLYVNRGIGMEGDWAPRVRFASRPEVTVIDIVPAAGP